MRILRPLREVAITYAGQAITAKPILTEEAREILAATDLDSVGH